LEHWLGKNKNIYEKSPHLEINIINSAINIKSKLVAAIYFYFFYASAS